MVIELKPGVRAAMLLNEDVSGRVTLRSPCLRIALFACRFVVRVALFAAGSEVE